MSSQKINVDLSHRIPNTLDFISKEGNLHDAVHVNLWRAMSILRFVRDAALDEGLADGEQAYWSIDAAINELKDIGALVDAHYQASKSTDQQPIAGGVL